MNLPDFTAPPRAVAIDLDGTLLNSAKEISERNRRALERCIEAGLPVIIATARPARWMPRLFGPVEMAAFSFVNQNGSVARGSAPLAGLLMEVLPRPLVEDVMAAMLDIEPEMRLTLELDGWDFGTNRPRDAVELWGVNAAFPEMQLSIAEALEQDVTKVAAGGLDRDITHVAAMLRERFGERLSVVPGDGFTFLNITLREATKPNAIERLLKTAGLSLDDVLTLGDDIPDLDMFRACGIAVAMANACPEILAATPWRTAANDDDGVALVLEKLLEQLTDR